MAATIVLSATTVLSGATLVVYTFNEVRKVLRDR